MAAAPLILFACDLPQGPDAGVFGLMDRAVVDEFNKLPERVPGMRYDSGR